MSLMRHAAAAALALATVSAAAGDAAADDDSMAALRALPRKGWYLPVGVNAGVAGVGSDAFGAIVGVEASVARLSDDFAWFGAYADAGYLTNGSALRFSAGPEVGLWFVGVDGGFLDIVEGGRHRTGLTVRPLLTLGVIALYVRWDHTFEDGGGTAAQIGALLKYPIPLEGQKIHF